MTEAEKEVLGRLRATEKGSLIVLHGVYHLRDEAVTESLRTITAARGLANKNMVKLVADQSSKGFAFTMQKVIIEEM